MNVHLVDGTFELFRCFHGAPRAQDADGNEVGAVRGLLFTLVALLRREHVTHVAVAFDQMTSRASDRSDSALLRRQYLPGAEAVRVLGIPVWPMHRYQADDALATGAARYSADPRVEQIVLCTTDKDLLQCVRGDRVVLLDRIRKRVTNERDVLDRFGVPPARIPELFGLVGDPSDGLPGVPRWGPKSAAAVLARYGRIEDIPDDPADWDVAVRGRDALAASLGERRREAIMVRDLSILRTDLPLSEDVDDLEWCGAHRARLEAFVERVGGEDVLDRIARWR